MRTAGLGIDELVGFESADDATYYFSFGAGFVFVFPEEGAREKARGEGFEDLGVERVRVGDGEEEGVYAAQGGDVLLFEGDYGCLAGEGGRRGEDGYFLGEGYGCGRDRDGSCGGWEPLRACC